MGAAAGSVSDWAGELHQLSRRAAGGKAAGGADMHQSWRDSCGGGAGFFVRGKTRAERTANSAAVIEFRRAHRISDGYGRRTVGVRRLDRSDVRRLGDRRAAKKYSASGRGWHD